MCVPGFPDLEMRIVMKKKKIIKIILCGGLGNQLFQYAFARWCIAKFGGNLVLDVRTGFERDFKYCRSYELDAFKLFDDVQVRQLSRVGARVERIRLALAYRNVPLGRAYLLEKKFDEEEAISCNNAFFIIHGYWQSEAYASELGEVLRSELEFRRSLSEQNRLLASRMSNQDSVAIHVRRVSYDQKLDLDYYRKALKRIQELVPGAKYYCFSDDREWCEHHLHFVPNMVMIDNSSLPAIEDFQLMTYCKHFIIANSTFSWWAAWLGGADGFVINPQMDVRQSQSNSDNRTSRWESVVLD